MHARLAHVMQEMILTLCVLAGLMPSTRTPTAAAQALFQPQTLTQQAIVAPAAVALSYSSYLGGSSTDTAKSVAVDAAGNIYIAGETFSEDLLGQDTPISGYSDIFVAKFNPAGSELLHLTIIGSGDSDYALAISADGQGNAYVTGNTYTQKMASMLPLMIR